jgi:hypothetical protein
MVAQDQGWVAAIGLPRGESAAVIVRASAEAVRRWAEAIGLELAAESVAATDPALVVLGSGAEIGRDSATIGPASVVLGWEVEIGLGLATIDPASVVLGSGVEIGRGWAVIGPASVGPGWEVAIGRDSPAVRGQAAVGVANSGPAAAIGPDGPALVQVAVGVANVGLAAAIGPDGLAIVLEFQAETGPSPVATGPDGPATAPVSGLAISVPAMSGRSAITWELSTGPITAATLTTTSAAVVVAAGAVVTGG